MTSKIVIIGAGALGSHLVMLLRNVDASIVVVDFDRVEQKNTMSQLHGRAGVGKHKTTGLVQTMNLLWKRRVVARPVEFRNDNADVLLEGADLVVDCTDNMDARLLIQGHCTARKIPCLHGALAANGEYGRVVWSEDFRADAAAGEAATCEDGEQLPFIAVTAGLLAMAVQAFAADGRRIGFAASPSHVEKI